MQNNLLNLIRLSTSPTISDCDWSALLKLAQEQAVMGVTLQGIQKLPKEQWPPRKLLLQWISCVESIKWQNEKVDAALKDLIAELGAQGVKPFVVKGQIVAQEYEEPLARQSGDIDVFIRKEDWTKVEQWMQKKGIVYSSYAAEKHIEIDYQGISVELHHHLNAFSNKSVMQYWQKKLEDKVDERHRTIKVDGTDIMTLGITDTLVHLMVHAHHHLLTEGVGLRQLMDMALFLNNHFDELDLSLLHQHIVGIGHEKAFNAYIALLNKYLGLPKEQIPFELDVQDYVYADKIMEEVWRGGNFGHKNNLKGVKPGLLHSLNTARLVIGHSIRFYRLVPAESRAYWWRKIFWRTKRITK